MSWRPLVEGTLAERCVSTAREIAAELATMTLGNASLASGDAGVALLHAYLHQHEPEREHDERAIAALDRAIDSLGEGGLSLDLYQGLTGIAWVSEHLQGRLLVRGDEDANADVDEILGGELDADDPGPRWDLISGFIGHGVYAHERLRHGAGAAMLARILTLLEARAVQTPAGLAWRTDHALLGPTEAARFPDGAFDPHVAHGVAGAIALLAAMHAAGIERPRVRRLLDGAVAWLLAQRLPSSSTAAFPFYAGDQGPSRMAWCRGDPGTAIALLAAARTTATAGWADAALAIARHTLERDAHEGTIIDATLCHGAGGLAHLYARLFHATGDPMFAAGARRWAEETVAMRRPGTGACGYVRWYVDAWDPAPGFLMGAAGVALGLLSVATAVEPAWDACLLTTLPTTP